MAYGVDYYAISEISKKEVWYIFIIHVSMAQC